MKAFSVAVVLVAIFLLTTCALAQLPPPPPPPGSPQSADKPSSPPTKGTAGVQGTVLTADGNRPVRKATVALMPEVSQMGEGRQEMQTEADGKFAFKDLPAGRYRITVQHPTFVSPSRTRMPNTIVTLIEGKQTDDVVFRLVPGAVIKGRITDEDGDPMPRVQVQVLQQRYIRGRKQLLPSGNAQTNDLGEYRIHALAPGLYFVSASRNQMMVMAPSGGEPKPNSREYVRTFYPAALEMQAASPVEVRAGDEVPVDISLQKADTVLVKGTLLTASGDKAANGVVYFAPANEGGFPFSTSPAFVRDGSFEARVPPGRYHATAMIMQDQSNPGSMTYANMTVDVGQSGADGVKIQGAPGVKVAIHVRFEGNASAIKLENVQMMLTPRLDDDSSIFALGMAGGSGKPNKDGVIEMEKVTPGMYDVVWNSSGRGFEDFYLKTVSVGGRDVSASGLRVGGDAMQVQVVIAANAPRVDGVAMDANQRAMKGAYVVAIPDGEMRKREQNYRVATTDQNGHFLLRSVRPGRYTLVALDDPEYGSWMDPEVLKTIEDKGETISVSETDRKTVQLKVLPSDKASAAVAAQ